MSTNEVLYRVTSKTFVAGVVTIDDMIVRTASILRKFRGQPILNLYQWATKNGMEFDWVSGERKNK